MNDLQRTSNNLYLKTVTYDPRYIHSRTDPEGGGERGPDPPEKSQNIEPENHKATKPAFNVGPSSASHLNSI